jgi:hypothetical protein
MLRRSSRKSKAPAAENEAPYAELSDSDVNASGNELDYIEPPKKRQKVHKKSPLNEAQTELATGKKTRGRRGFLKELVNMPLDVLFEVCTFAGYSLYTPFSNPVASQIFGHLNPADILHLARTTKELRVILMDRSAQWIWQRTRTNVKDLPDCPDDMTEPQYAHLAFDPQCHVS